MLISFLTLLFLILQISSQHSHTRALRLLTGWTEFALEMLILRLF